MLVEQAFYEDELPNGPAYGLDNVFGSIAEVVLQSYMRIKDRVYVASQACLYQRGA